MQALLAPLALLFDRVFGYPTRLVDAIGHPVLWMGRFIAVADARFNNPRRSFEVRRNAGIVMLVVLLLVTLLVCFAVLAITRRIPQGWVVEALLASTLLAQHELGRAVRAVAAALDVSLVEGRKAVSHIVGRDPEALDEPGVARAAIESLAESSCDGVIAPLFWLLLGGLPGIALYKAINTADSMIGHLNDRHRHFGWASAKLDDLVNWIPARLTALLIVGAAFFAKGADTERAWKTALRDAKKHASPNAGWPEAATAGALGVSLGGPRAYGGITLDLPAFGDGRRELGAADIRSALRLYGVMLNLTLGVTAVIALMLWRAGLS
jgi:adenosylcobinamide-phosphate synthase